MFLSGNPLEPDLAGMSARQLERNFHRKVGVGPKSFARIVRFQNVLNCLDHRQSHHWLDLALECGYFDQSHFIRDFCGFSGRDPAAFMKDFDGLTKSFARAAQTSDFYKTRRAVSGYDS